MDGGTRPPSFDLLCLTVPGEITTAINDGFVTAAIVFDKKKEPTRDDCRAGQKFFIREVVDVLQEQGFIGGDDSGYNWLKPLDGKWQVEVDGRAYTIYGQKERRLSTERNMLGETSEDDANKDTAVGLFMRGVAQPFEIQIIGAHGKVLKETRKFQVHPLALTIPAMTEQEREQLRESILRDGVQVPIVIYQDKVLDGRHRFYFAATLKKPVRIEEFEGTDEEAKRRIALLNLHRRHLTGTQQVIAAVALFGEEARRKTTEAQKKAGVQGNWNRPRLGTVVSPTGDMNRGPRYEEIVARKAQEVGMTGVTPRSVKALKGIERAPETRARINDGQLGRIRDAKAAINTELQRGKTSLLKSEMPEDLGRQANPPSAFERLGHVLLHVTAIATDESMPPGGASADIPKRVAEIETYWTNMKRALRLRGLL